LAAPSHIRIDFLALKKFSLGKHICITSEVGLIHPAIDVGKNTRFCLAFTLLPVLKSCAPTFTQPNLLQLGH